MSPVWNQPSSNASRGGLRRVVSSPASRCRRAPGSRRRGRSSPRRRESACRPSPLRRERMVQRDDRRRLRQAVALDDQRSRAAHQNSSRSGSSGAAPTTNAQNFKPNSRCTSRCRHHRFSQCSPDRQARPPSARDADDVSAQHVENLRHRHQHRDAPRSDLPDDLVRVVSRA